MLQIMSLPGTVARLARVLIQLVYNALRFMDKN